MKKGCFISFEGMDGAGKSTQIKKLKLYLENEGFEVMLTREPGGTPIGEKLRGIILSPNNSEMTALTEVLLYAASRAQHVEEVIKPAVSEGKIVICDRFVDSSIAYQGYGRELLEAVKDINGYAVCGKMPDITFLMKISPNAGIERIGRRAKDRIEMEEESFRRRVYLGYENLARLYPERVVEIDASKTIDEIFGEIVKSIDKVLEV